jgi:protein-tyrosine phosphatase
MIQVTDGIFRGPRPNSLTDIPGISTVLSLESGWFEVFHDEMYAEDIMEEAIRILHVPINSIGAPPSKQSLDQALKIMMSKNTYPLYVHCKQGVDRTGLAVAHYRIIAQGWTFDKAIQEMKDMGFHMWMYWWWIPYYKKFVLKL